MTLKKDKPAKVFRPKTDKLEKKAFRPKTEKPEKFEKSDKPLQPPKPKVNTTVYVSNLSYRRDEVGIKKLFTRYGSIKKIKIVIDLETEKSRGMAFVEMATVAQAKAAIDGLNGEIIDGRTLKASWSIPQEKPFYKKFDDRKATDFDDKKHASKPFKKFEGREATGRKTSGQSDKPERKPFKKIEKKAPRKLKG